MPSAHRGWEPFSPCSFTSKIARTGAWHPSSHSQAFSSHGLHLRIQGTPQAPFQPCREQLGLVSPGKDGLGDAGRRDHPLLGGTCPSLRVGGWVGCGPAPFFFFSACLFSALARMSVLLLVCLFQASVMWRFIHFQLRRWREYWHEQSSRKRAAAATAGAKQQAKPLKRDSGEHRWAPGVAPCGAVSLVPASLAERGAMSQGSRGAAPRGCEV